MNMPNINISKEQIKDFGVNILGQVKKERGTIAAVSAAVLSGLCLWSIRRLNKIVEGK